MNKKIVVQDSYQDGYTYLCTEPIGENFDTEFKPHLSPKEMLQLGIFGGVYMSDKPDEFPRDWFDDVEFSPDGREHKELNFFGILASQSLQVW